VTIVKYTISTRSVVDSPTSYMAPEGKLQPWTTVTDLALSPAGGLFVSHDPTNGGTNGALVSTLPWVRHRHTHPPTRCREKDGPAHAGPSRRVHSGSALNFLECHRSDPPVPERTTARHHSIFCSAAPTAMANSSSWNARRSSFGVMRSRKVLGYVGWLRVQRGIREVTAIVIGLEEQQRVRWVPSMLGNQTAVHHWNDIRRASQ
jgi:hypothetical protein